MYIYEQEFLRAAYYFLLALTKLIFFASILSYWGEGILTFFSFDNFFNAFLQMWNIRSNSVPDDIVINPKVVMNDLITDVTHVSPRGERIFRFKVGMYFTAGFTDYFKASANGSG
jgi:hypothetical protein